MITTGDGATHRYTDLDPGTGVYVAPPQAVSSLRKTETGWIETQSDGLEFVYDFHPAGWLSLDLDGWLDFELADWLAFGLEGTPQGTLRRLTNIQTAGGATWTLAYDGPMLQTSK